MYAAAMYSTISSCKHIPLRIGAELCVVVSLEIARYTCVRSIRDQMYSGPLYTAIALAPSETAPGSSTSSFQLELRVIQQLG